MQTKKTKKSVIPDKTTTVTSNVPKENQQIINVLTAVKNYYAAMKNTIHVNAYERAIYQLKRWQNPIITGKDVKDLEGIGKGMVEKIDTILKTGTLPVIGEKGIIVEDIFSDIAKAKDVNDLTTVLGFGEKFVARLKSEFEIETIAQLEKALADGKKVPLTRQQQIGLKWHNELNEPIPRSETQSFYNKIIDTPAIKSLIDKYKLAIRLAGSFPSGKKSSKDIDLLIATPRNEYITRNQLMKKIVDAIKTAGFCLKIEILNHGKKGTKKHPSVVELGSGVTKFLGLVTSREANSSECIYRHLDIRLVTYKAYPFARLYYCSGKVFNIMIRQKLRRKGYKLSEWGLYYGETGGSATAFEEDGSVDLDEEKMKKGETLDEYADRIEKKIFELADMEYKTIPERY